VKEIPQRYSSYFVQCFHKKWTAKKVSLNSSRGGINGSPPFI
jgi:hypothetical protein